MGGAQVPFILALTLRFPVALYFVGPVVMGGLHLAADVRYLALRRRLPRTLLIASVALAAVFTAVRVSVRLHVANPILGDRVNVALGVIWVGVALALRVRDSRRALLVVAPLFVVAASLVLVFAQACDVLLHTSAQRRGARVVAHAVSAQARVDGPACDARRRRGGGVAVRCVLALDDASRRTRCIRRDPAQAGRRPRTRGATSFRRGGCNDLRISSIDPLRRVDCVGPARLSAR